MPPASLTAAQIRREINARAEAYARAHHLLYDLSSGPQPSVIFGRDALGFHGNFHPESYNRILAHPDWARRLSKPHTASRRSVARKDWRWMELDSATSSDALLMNVFCHPDVFDDTSLNAPIAALLGTDRASQPRFGANPGVPLATPLKPRSKRAAPLEAFDRTEIDLVLSGPTTTLFVEAKLTESDFQTASPALLSRYRDLATVFDPDRLRVPHSSRSDGWGVRVSGNQNTPTTPVPHSPRKPGSPSSLLAGVRSDEWGVSIPHNPENPEPIDPDIPDDFLVSPTPTRERIAGYQLIRNILAAHAADAGFCLLLDARRRDLIDIWYAVLSAVRSPSFATRLRVLTWQDLTPALPPDLRHFLAAKYG
ncbi:MAG TPA: hypothetical protein VJU82_12780, partial [Acidobacteriaceae bacterium]|nr:hypothetical protein [Acidobacteriaceae bacterium]